MKQGILEERWFWWDVWTHNAKASEHFLRCKIMFTDKVENILLTLIGIQKSFYLWLGLFSHQPIRIHTRHGNTHLKF